MKNIAVLGAGIVGAAMARELSAHHSVTVFDRDSGVLQALRRHSPAGIKTQLVDVEDNGLRSLLGGCDWVVSAVPGAIGFQTLSRLIEWGFNTVDISFMPEDALVLQKAAVAAGVVAVVDMGIAPGFDNVVLGHHDVLFAVKKFSCMVGGLPKVRQWPTEYKATFSPRDVLEEYIRRARYVSGGAVVEKPPLTDIEHIEFPRIGTLEAFNTDGLRSLLQTMKHIPDMVEKTLRYPGHAMWMQGLSDMGFFTAQPDETGTSPLEHTARVLSAHWKKLPNEGELTVMRIDIVGVDGARTRKVVVDVYAENDAATTDKAAISSMAKCTGYSCTGALSYILENGLSPGVYPPEQLGGMQGFFAYLCQYMRHRGVDILVRES